MGGKEKSDSLFCSLFSQMFDAKSFFFWLLECVHVCVYGEDKCSQPIGCLQSIVLKDQRLKWWSTQLDNLGSKAKKCLHYHGYVISQMPTTIALETIYNHLFWTHWFTISRITMIVIHLYCYSLLALKKTKTQTNNSFKMLI